MRVTILKKKLHDKLGRLVEELNLTARIRLFVKLYQRLLTGDIIKISSTVRTQPMFVSLSVAPIVWFYKNRNVRNLIFFPPEICEYILPTFGHVSPPSG